METVKFSLGGVGSANTGSAAVQSPGSWLTLSVKSPPEIPNSLLRAKNIRTKVIFRVFKGPGF